MSASMYRDHKIKRFEENNHFFIIDDDSRWKVRDHYHDAVKNWKVGDSISVSLLGMTYQTVENLTRGNSIEARKIP